MRAFLLGAAAVVGLAGVATATSPLELCYMVTDLGGGLFNYDFVLENTNADGSWFPGHSANWITFGDSPVPGGSPLNSFAGNVPSLVGTPWANEGFTFSSGGHNGPTLLDFDDFGNGWIPGFVGDSVSWSGTATVHLGQGQLLWSNLIGAGNHADFLVATECIPAPGAGVLLGVGGLVAMRRRR
jgi:hypothetical protein